MKSKYPALIRSSLPEALGVAKFVEMDNDVIFTIDPKSSPVAYLQSRVDHDGEPHPGVRVFKSSPESMTVQIRTYGPVGESHRGKTRAAFSCFTYNRQGMLKLAAEIERIAKMLPEA